ncbi:MAG: type III secretion system export apparatus subunit SctU [bacterium]|nr:type III secretion system export apparatus subunit SctU [bacterium]
MAQGGGGDKGSQEKTEEPTPKRLRDARKKGQVWQSRDLTTILVLIASFISLAVTLPYISNSLQTLMKNFFEVVSRPEISFELMFEMIQSCFFVLIKISAPVALTAVIVALIASFLQVGPVFSMETLKPKLEKLNVIEGIKNMFKTKTFVELVKNIIKITFIFIIAITVVKGLLGDFLQMAVVEPEHSAQFAGTIIVRFLVRVFALFLLVAILDVFFQRKDYLKNLRMSKEEVKREYKEDEGDPLIKSHRKQLHREMAMTDARQGVKTADVVVTNPTHLAIALKYDTKEMVAPQIVAKGQRIFAEYIRELAVEFNVPTVQNIPLAWSLIELEIGDEVPEDLYQAVAEILTFVYQMKEREQKP